MNRSARRWLRIAALSCALLLAHPAAAADIARWEPQIAEAAQRFGIPADWIARVIRAESGGRTTLRGRPIISPKGAMGLMQLMPGTWGEAHRALRLGDDPHDARDNILAGSWYLRRMYDRFGYPGLFAAYNAGPARYAAVLDGRAALPAETRRYVAQITRAPLGTPYPAPLPGSGGLFFELRAPPRAGLFAIRKDVAASEAETRR